MSTEKALREYLKKTGKYEEIDEALIGQFTTFEKFIKAAEDELLADGIIDDENGRAHPAVNVHIKYLDKMRDFMVALGLTRRERNKIKEDSDIYRDDFDNDE